jgi:hypothetical protein
VQAGLQIKKRRPEVHPGVFVFAKIGRLFANAFADCVYRTCVNASSTVDTASFVDNSFVTGFADCSYRTGIVTGTAVDAFVRNGISQDIHLPLFIYRI